MNASGSAFVLTERSLTRATGNSERSARLIHLVEPSNNSPSIISFTIPRDFAFSAEIKAPEVINSKACSAPMILGSRCVPPAPGKIPSFTSGNPTMASLLAKR